MGMLHAHYCFPCNNGSFYYVYVMGSSCVSSPFGGGGLVSDSGRSKRCLVKLSKIHNVFCRKATAFLRFSLWKSVKMAQTRIVFDKTSKSTSTGLM
jgi:hypothetical protein